LVSRFPQRFYADEATQPAAKLGDCVTPLVLEADGNVVPIGHGFGRRYAVGSVRSRRLRDLAPEWISQVYPKFRELCRRVHAEACRPSQLPFINWYEMLQLASADASHA